MTVCAETVRILFTNNSNGKLVDCNCPNDPYGGLAERVALIREYRQYYSDFLLFDSGGFLGLSEIAKRGEAVFRLMDVMGYNAAGIGDQELYHGLGRYLVRYGDSVKNILNATILDKDGNAVFERYRVFTVKGIRIGVTGVTSSETFRFFPKDRKDFIDVNPDSVLAVLIPMMRKECDYSIILSQMGRENDIKLAERVPGIDCIIGGHSQTLLEKPLISGGCHIVQAGRNGGHIGEILVRFDDTKKPVDFTYKLLEVSGRYKIPDDIVTMLTEEYNVDIQ